eukprot:TRINITY_DN3372_c0_g1_i6.p1 TRINITY_DN3372_c0_g1~~TRINITY_DN3372_c0_g1_i6.p1  ORF type:complete len:215 (+),score=41.33 TRINITY_DN3372_c0_g1_i6:19-663(+)
MSNKAEDPRVRNQFRKIHAIFNHKSFFANMQEEDMPFKVFLNIKDPTLWKAMGEDNLKILKTTQNLDGLIPAIADVIPEEMSIETRLKAKLAEYRTDLQIGTRFDEKMSYFLTTSLINYEFERLTGQTFAAEEFQDAVRNYVPSGHTFKAFPIQMVTKDISKIFRALKNAPKCDEIMRTKGDQVYFAIKVRIVPYPEKIFALWISVAVRYLSIE